MPKASDFQTGRRYFQAAMRRKPNQNILAALSLRGVRYKHIVFGQYEQSRGISSSAAT